MALSEGDPYASYRTAPHRHPPVTAFCSDITPSLVISLGRFCRPRGGGNGFSSFRPGPASPSGKPGLSNKLPHPHPGLEYDLERLARGIGAGLMRVGTNPSIDTRAIALHRGVTPPFGRVIGSEHNRCGTVSCRVRSPAVAWHVFPFPMGVAKGKHTARLSCRAFADLA